MGLRITGKSHRIIFLWDFPIYVNLIKLSRELMKVDHTLRPVGIGGTKDTVEMFLFVDAHHEPFVFFGVSYVQG